MANSSTQGNVGQASGHAHNTTANGLKYRSTNSGQPLAHADVDNNFEILRKAINGVVSDIDAVVKTDVPTGAVFTDTTYNAVTDSVSGLMTGAMKQKLDGIASGAEVNVQSNWNATSGDAQILNKPTIVNTAVTTSANGLMTAADKVKLDGIQAGATAGGGASSTTSTTAPSNPSDGDLWFNENKAELYVYTTTLNSWIQVGGGGGGGSSAVSLWQDSSGNDATISGGTEYSPPDQSYNFATFYFYSNPLHWNEYAYFRYYFDTSTSYLEVFRHKGAGDGGGSVVASNLVTVPLYPNASGQKVVRVTWSNLAYVRGKWWS